MMGQMNAFDSLVIGAGVVGLAVARALAKSGRRVVIVEKEADIGQGISSRNSEVIHAGLYYPPDSLKAKACIDGRKRLYHYADERGIPHRKTGKLIVACSEAELSTLDSLHDNARNSGVTSLRALTKKEAQALEPQLNCVAALLSPESGIIDSHQLMLSMLADAESDGAILAKSADFIRAQMTKDGFKTDIGDQSGAATPFQCREIVNAAGLQAVLMASRIDALAPHHIPQLRLSKGVYFSHAGGRPFSGLVYPVPEAHGLGIHATVDLAGQVRFGPDHNWIDQIAYDVPEDRAWPFYNRIRRYFPALKDGALIPAYAGIRPKITMPGSADGAQPDFVVQGPETHQIPGLVNLFGIESPGLTASLALAELVLTRLDTAAA